MNLNRHFRRATGVTLVTLTLGACDFISPVESNPNAVPEATVDQLFTGAQVVSYFLSHGGLSRIASIWTQQMAGTDRQFATFDNYVITDADFEDEFNALYTQGGLIDIRSAIAQAEAAGRTTYAGILKVHEAYLVGLIASFYGDIPYTEAANPDIEFPALDDQAAVYADVQALLDEAIADLSSGAGLGPGAVDLNFGGDAASWIAVANTLKARFYLHWAEVDPANYAAAATAAASGVTTNAGNWESKFGSPQTETNLWTQFLVDRSGYVSSGDYLVPLLVANADPRIGIYFSPADAGPPAVYTARVSELADPGYGAATYDLPIVSCAENYFIIAEAEYAAGAEPAARTAARAAAACQEAEHGLAADALGSVTGFAGTGAALLDEIMEQKYIALFLNPEVFNDYKRTCLPAISERASGMPGRLYYASQERQSNPNIPQTGTDPNDKYNDNDPAPC